MKAVVEFVGYFRMKAGSQELTLELDDNASVFELIKLIEQKLEARSFRILENGRMMSGVLVFSRNSKGGMERIYELSTGLEQIGGRIILANLMGGG